MAESFGADAARYDRARQPYPARLISRLLAETPGPDILDVGCGTGIEARQLLAAGCTVTGVEPDERMGAFARAGGLPVETSRFEDWDAAGRTFDAVVAGTAWHWIDPEKGAVKAADVLRHGGLLAPFWHVTTVPEPVQDALADAFERVAPESPVRLRGGRPGLAGYQPILDTAASGMRACGAFGEPEQWVFPWDKEYSRDEWTDQLPTTGILTRLPAALVADVQQAVGDAIDRLGGRITVHYESVVVAARRKS